MTGWWLLGVLITECWVLTEREVYHCITVSSIKLVIYHNTWGHTQLPSSVVFAASRNMNIEIFIRFEHFFISYLLRHYLCARICTLEAHILAAVPLNI